MLGYFEIRMENFEIRNIAKSEEIGKFEVRIIYVEIRNERFETRTIMLAVGNFADFNVTYMYVIPKRRFSGFFVVPSKRFECRTVCVETRRDQFEIRNVNHSRFETINSMFEV